MPASASAAAITASNICNDAVGFVVDGSAAANVIPVAGCGCSVAAGLVAARARRPAVGRRLARRPRQGPHIGRVACGICTLIAVEPSARGQRSWREHVRPDAALAILNGWHGGRCAGRLRLRDWQEQPARRGIAGRSIPRARRRSPWRHRARWLLPQAPRLPPKSPAMKPAAWRGWTCRRPCRSLPEDTSTDVWSRDRCDNTNGCPAWSRPLARSGNRRR